MSTTDGLFLTFEGMDGSGKTTQMRLLADRLRRSGREVVETVEPGGTPIGQQIRRILLDPAHHELDPRAELLLYFASRAQNVHELILPALARGAVVLCDRFTDSTLVYQGAGRDLGEPAVRDLHRLACGTLQPHRTFFLDLDLATSLDRARARNQETGPDESRMDEQSNEFYERVRRAYLALAASEPARFRVINAAGSVEDVHEAIFAAVTTAMEDPALVR